jgi:hypothetical protein
MDEPVSPADTPPESILKTRPAFAKPAGQFTLRTFFIGVTIVACASFVAKISSGSVVLSFLPLAGAFLIIALLVSALYYWLRIEGLLIGGLSAALPLFVLCLIPLWIEEGLDEKSGGGRVAWERVQISELGLPLLVWLAVFAVVAGIGMVIGGAASARARWWRDRQREATAKREGVPRFVRAREAFRLTPRFSPAIAILFSLMIVAWICGVLLRAGNSYAIDAACWLGAIGFHALLLIIVGQATRRRGIPVGGIVLVIVFALATTFPIWRFLGRPPTPLYGYVLTVDASQLTLHAAVLWTFCGWLQTFSIPATIGALAGWWLARQRRRKPLLKPLPVEFPNSEV